MYMSIVKRLSATLSIVASSLVGGLVTIFLAMLCADYVQDLRGVPEPRDFDGVLLSTFFSSIAVALILFLLGIYLAIRFWVNTGQSDGDNICSKCGYSLHGLSNSTNSCPECGTEIEFYN